MLKTRSSSLVYLALGSNLGDRLAYLREALKALNQHPAVRVIHASGVYESDAHTLDPADEQPLFLNAVSELEVDLPPTSLLSLCKDIERNAGRNRSDTPRWSARTLDLDLLVYGDRTLASPTLTLPHPRLGMRNFVLLPWAELAPNLYVPSPYDATVITLLRACTDPTLPRRTAFSLWDRSA